MFGFLKRGTGNLKIPQISVSDENVRNIYVMHKSGKKFTVAFERYDFGGKCWIAEKKIIDPSITGFSAGRSTVNIQWR